MYAKISMLSLGIILAFTLVLTIVPIAGASEADDLLAEAEALYPERADMATAQKISGIYEKVIAVAPDNVEARWKYSRILYWIGIHLTDKQEKQVIFLKGIEAAKAGIAIDENSVRSHYWLGICYGVYGESKGILKSLNLVKPIKQEMNLVIKLDPDYDMGSAYRMLGRVSQKVPGLAGGSKKKAVIYYQKALEIGPDSVLTHLFLAETYLSLRKKDMARKTLEKALEAKDLTDPGDIEDQEDIRELYEKHFTDKEPAGPDRQIKVPSGGNY